MGKGDGDYGGLGILLLVFFGFLRERIYYCVLVLFGYLCCREFSGSEKRGLILFLRGGRVRVL